MLVLIFTDVVRRMSHLVTRYRMFAAVDTNTQSAVAFYY